MRKHILGLLLLTMAVAETVAVAQTNPLWHETKVKNFLPHMTWPEVRDLLTRSDMVVIPVPSIVRTSTSSNETPLSIMIDRQPGRPRPSER